mmetsp:Transcript_38805/g.109794  ORF Transcript_38805/g.109794 Transcript_38805/m.109794 type:complete len:250 (+) Transcript_38805:704-1453(+)
MALQVGEADTLGVVALRAILHGKVALVESHPQVGLLHKEEGWLDVTQQRLLVRKLRDHPDYLGTPPETNAPRDFVGTAICCVVVINRAVCGFHQIAEPVGKNRPQGRKLGLVEVRPRNQGTFSCGFVPCLCEGNKVLPSPPRVSLIARQLVVKVVGKANGVDLVSTGVDVTTPELSDPVPRVVVALLHHALELIVHCGKPEHVKHVGAVLDPVGCEDSTGNVSSLAFKNSCWGQGDSRVSDCCSADLPF